MNDTEREDWIINYQPLYNMYLESGLAMSTFIRRNRKEIDQIIATVQEGTS